MEFDQSSCPPAVIERIHAADLSSDDNDSLFSWIESEASLECQLHSVGAIAGRIDGSTHPLVFSDFASSAATYADLLGPDDVEAVRQAYLRFPYDEDIAAIYFLGLRTLRIDIRDRLRPAVVEDWSFTDPGSDAATWHYYLYLASLDEPEALDKIARKLAATQNGNDLTNLLRSLGEVKTQGVTDLLLSYSNDQRRSDDPEETGGGPTISETIGYIMQLREAAQ